MYDLVRLCMIVVKPPNLTKSVCKILHHYIMMKRDEHFFPIDVDVLDQNDVQRSFHLDRIVELNWKERFFFSLVSLPSDKEEDVDSSQTNSFEMKTLSFFLSSSFAIRFEHGKWIRLDVDGKERLHFHLMANISSLTNVRWKEIDDSSISLVDRTTFHVDWEEICASLSLSLFSRLCWGRRFSSLNRQALTTKRRIRSLDDFNLELMEICHQWRKEDRFSICNCSIVKMKNLLIFLPILRWSMNEFLHSNPIDCWRFHRWAIISIQDGMERRFYPNTGLIQLDITLKRKIFDQRQFFFFFCFFNRDKQRFLFERTERKEKISFCWEFVVYPRKTWRQSKLKDVHLSFLLSMDSKRFSSTWSFVIHRLESVQSNILDSISISNWEEKEEGEELALETNSHFHELSSFISVQCSSMKNERSIV